MHFSFVQPVAQLPSLRRLLRTHRPLGRQEPHRGSGSQGEVEAQQAHYDVTVPTQVAQGGRRGFL